jgi:hypothetical protein
MVTVKMIGLKEALESMNPAKVTQAASLSLNDAARSGRTEGGREIRARWNVQASKVNAELKNVQFSRRDDLSAIIQAKGRSISLTYFGAKEVRDTKNGVLTQDRRKGKLSSRSSAARGVTVQILRGQTTRLPKSFINALKSGYIGVFRRVAGSRKIVDMSTITIASMFQQERVQERTISAAVAKWKERFAYHLDRLAGPSST